MLQLSPSQSLAAIDRPVELIMRSDLLVSERRLKGKTYYIVKDPLTLAHHQLWEEEFVLLRMLDGKTTLAQMKEMFTKQFTHSRLDLRRLQWLHGQFHRNGLIVSNGVGQSQELFRRESEQKWKLRRSQLSHWMAIRFRGFNPDSMLEAINKQTGWIFSPQFMLSSFLGILFTALFLLVNSTGVASRLPTIDEFITVNNGVWLFVAFCLLKIIHEFGHGMACKHFGGECNEMGVMLLLFTPCLYCDVSDSWMIQQRWKRAFIALAGIWFELIAASICAWIWWLSNPGTINSLAFHAMLVGSVGTLLFNGNPLLKYDGYFVLSDLWDRPNLGQNARQSLRDSVARFFMRNANPSNTDPTGRGTGLLIVYAILAAIYRGVLLVVILFVLFRLFQAARLELIGVFLIASVVAGAILRTTRPWVSAIATPNKLKHLRAGRVSIVAIAVIALIAAVIWFPLPARVSAPVFITTHDAENIVIIVEGNILNCVPEGTSVRKGDVIATLQSKELELNLASRRGELAQLRARLDGLESRRVDDNSVSPQIPTVREAIAGLEVEVQRLEAESERLIVKSPIDGTIVGSEHAAAPEQNNELRQWSGRPLAPENNGCFLKRGTTLCQVVPNAPRKGTLFLHQGQVELVRTGQKVHIKAQEHPQFTYTGTINEVGASEITEAPDEIIKSNLIPHRVDSAGKNRPSEPMFVASVDIERLSDTEPEKELMHQTIGEASIGIAPLSIGARLKRLIFETFALDPTVQQRSGQSSR